MRSFVVLCALLCISGIALAQPPTPETICLLDVSVDPMVSLAWAELEPGAVSPVSGERLTLVVQNRTERLLRARIRLRALGNERAGGSRAFVLRLIPGARREVQVGLRSLGFRIERLRSSGSVQAHVEVFAAESRRGAVQDGNRIPSDSAGSRRVDQSLSSVAYFHPHPSPGSLIRSILVYDEETMKNRFHSGDFRDEAGRFVEEALRLVPEPVSLEMIIDPLDGAPRGDDDNPIDDLAPGTKKFCYRIPLATEDSGTGEDFLAPMGFQTVPASYARVWIINFGTSVVDDERLDAQGCIAFPDVFESDVWTMLLLADAAIPGSNAPEDRNVLRSLDSGGNVAVWSWHAEFDTEQQPSVFYAGWNRRANNFGLASFSVGRFSDGLADEVLYVLDRACPPAPDNSCNGDFTTVDFQVIPVAFIHPDHNFHKFALAHEVGHAVVHRFFGGVHPSVAGMYDENAGGPECTWDGSHALHSTEFSASGLTEGFAQYYATAVFNSTDEEDAAFYYYKDAYKNGTVKEVDMADGPVGGVDAYLRNVCEGTEGEKAGRGVELDWARQFWDYRTKPGVQPANLALLEQLAEALNPPNFFGWTLLNSADRMFVGIEAFDADNATNFAERWDASDELNGIDF